MARSAGQNVDIRIKAYDEASPGFDAVAKSVRQLPNELSKAAAVFQMVGGAAGGMGEDVAQAAGKISGLASLVATGGVVGVGIAALTAAVALGAKTWELYNAQTDATAKMNATLGGTFELLSKGVAKSQGELKDLTDKLIYWGKTSEEMQIGKLEQSIALQEVQIKSNREEVESMRAAAAAMIEKAEAQEQDNDLEYLAHLRGQETAKQLRERAELELETAKNLELGTTKAEESYYANVNTVTMLEQLVTKTKAKEASGKSAEEARRAAAEKEKSDRAELARWEDEELAYYEKRKKALTDHLASLAKAFTYQSSYYSNIADLQEKEGRQADKLTEEKEKLDDDLKSAGVSAARSVSQAWTDAGIAMASGSSSGSEAAKQAVFSSARAAIMAASGEAAAKSIAAYSGIPFVGVAIGLSVAASVAAIILGYLSKFEQGGIVRGGSGVVPIGAHDGERVLSVRQTAAFERMVASLERQSGGSPKATLSGGSVVQLNRYSTFAPSSSATRRDLRDVMRLQKKLARRGW